MNVTATCPKQGKLRYENRCAALQALAGVRERRRRTASYAETYPYHCRTCGGWHLTSRSET